MILRTQYPGISIYLEINSMKLIRTKIASDIEEYKSVKQLVSEMYSWRGYHIDDEIASHKNENATTIISYDGDEVIGTFTMTFDNQKGNLYSDSQYPNSTKKLRESGELICEISKLAIKKINSRKYIACLFSILYMVCVLHETTTIIIEVNPRHENYYKKMLGFVGLDSGECERVKAPGILMALDLRYLTKQLELNYSGQRTKDLYNLFLNKDEMESLKSFLLSSKPCKFPSEEFTFELSK